MPTDLGWLFVFRCITLCPLRCEYNCMVDNPYRPGTELGNPLVGKCLDGKPQCQDCRLQTFDKVKSAHFTICQKPWTCTEHLNPKNKRLCSILHEKWFRLRDELEKETGVDISYRTALDKTRYKESLGMCSRFGDGGYISIPLTIVNNKSGGSNSGIGSSSTGLRGIVSS